MSLLIKNWSEADWKELLKWAKIGLNNAMIGEFAEVEELPPHGRLIDADALMLRVDLHGTNKFGMLDDDIREFIKAAPTIIPAEEGE